jgi:hypothetical protein
VAVDEVRRATDANDHDSGSVSKAQYAECED